MQVHLRNWQLRGDSHCKMLECMLNASTKMAAVLLLGLVAVGLWAGPVASQLIFNNRGNLPLIYEAHVSSGQSDECPAEQERAAVRNSTTQAIRRLLFPCGGTDGWRRFAHIDMTNRSQQCPTGLIEYTYDGIRLCSRPADDARIGCTSATLPGGGTPYSHVCGRIVGYLFGDVEAFGYYQERRRRDTIDDYYVDGVTLTHGPSGSREHIWTFAGATAHYSRWYQCPCAPGPTSISTDPPSFVGNDYFCESAVPTWVGRSTGLIFYNATLWDGEGCPESNSCECTLNDPPYFLKELPASTTDDIEMRFCGRLNLNDGGGALVNLVELYVK